MLSRARLREPGLISESWLKVLLFLVASFSSRLRVSYSDDYRVDSYRDGGEKENAESEGDCSETPILYGPAHSAIVGTQELRGGEEDSR